MKDFTRRLEDVWHVLTSGSYILLHTTKTGLDANAVVNHRLFDALYARLTKFIPNWYAQTYRKNEKKEGDETD